MFGVDEEQVDELVARRARRRRTWLRLAVTTLELVVFTPLLLAVGLGWLLLTPDGVTLLLENSRPNANSDVTLEHMAVHPASVWNEPDTWKVVFTGVDIVPRAPLRPTIHLDRVVLGAPDLRRLWQRRELHFGEGWLIGLHIQAKQQQPAPKRERRPEAIQLLAADTVHVWDASYDAPPDDPLPSAGVNGIFGTMHDVEYDPFSRKVSGTAALTAQRFHTGTFFVHHIDIQSFDADDGDLTLSDGTLWWEGQQARVSGTILDIDARSTVDLRVVLTHARVEQMVRSATGEQSPILGIADVDLRVHSGGDLPRGGGYMDATVRLTDAILPLPSGTRGIYKDIVRIAPIATLDEQDQVLLESMEGELRLQRGVVTVKELLYDARIPVVLRGTVDAEAMDLYVRFVLGGDPTVNPGRGLRLEGPLTAPNVTWATRDELLPGWREIREERRGGKGWNPFRRRQQDGEADAGIE